MVGLSSPSLNNSAMWWHKGKQTAALFLWLKSTGVWRSALRAAKGGTAALEVEVRRGRVNTISPTKCQHTLQLLSLSVPYIHTNTLTDSWLWLLKVQLVWAQVTRSSSSGFDGNSRISTFPQHPVGFHVLNCLAFTLALQTNTETEQQSSARRKSAGWNDLRVLQLDKHTAL